MRWQAGIEPPQARLDGVSILIVDDEPEVLSTLASADEALQLLDQHEPTVLVSDPELVGQIAQLAGRTAIQ